MVDGEKSKSGHEYKVAVFSGRVFKIYDGKGKDNVSEGRSVARKSFVDSVMEEIGDSVPFRAIDGGLSNDNNQKPDTKTVIDAPVHMEELNERFIGEIESVAERVGPKENIRIVGRRRHSGAKIIPFPGNNGGKIA